jgi:hypothetical protein
MKTGAEATAAASWFPQPVEARATPAESPTFPSARLVRDVPFDRSLPHEDDVVVARAVLNVPTKASPSRVRWNVIGYEPECQP